MPVLTDKNRKVTKIKLPSSTKEDPAWVTIYENILTRDVVELAKFQNNQSKASIAAITSLIADWNFTNEAGEKLPITEENVGLLDFKDLMAIMEKVRAFDNVQRLSNAKKNS